MTRRSLALVANFHRERRIGRKTANFLGHVQGRLANRGIDFNIEFVLDRPDQITIDAIEGVSKGISGSRVHVVEFANLGVSRTYGVRAARADVVCFTDGDDFFSFDWFEGALNYFSNGPVRDVLHTQYMVGFDQEQFIRETTQTTDEFFDPLSLAVDWYWSANLAIQTDVFASVPIEPYDHASGFGSEDWHWSCNCLDAGIRRVSLPGSSYFYRVKPERFALGKVADVIHMASPLFSRDRLPAPPPAPSNLRPPTTKLSAEFFAQAREIEAFELGLSFLRSVEVGVTEVRHFKPHTPPIVGSVIREALASGFGDGSSIIFFDAQRAPGGFEGVSAIATALLGAGNQSRLYIVEGDQKACGPREDGYAIHLGHLRSSGLYIEQIDRLLARFMIQHRSITVLNILSPRSGSRVLAFSRATRGSVNRWFNLVVEYGYDALSHAYAELDEFAASGVPAINIALFQKTALEASRIRGIAMGRLPALEAAYVAGLLETTDIDLETLEQTGSSEPFLREADDHATIVFRLTDESPGPSGATWSGGGWLFCDESVRDRIASAKTCVFVGGSSFLGEELFRPCSQEPGVLIPALTVTRQAKPPTYYFKPDIEHLNLSLKSGMVPADIGWIGAFGVSGDLLREVLTKRQGRIHLSEIIARSLVAAWNSGLPGLRFFSPNSVVSVSLHDIELLGGSRLAFRLGQEVANA